MSLRHTLPAFALLTLGLLVSAALLALERLCLRFGVRSWQYQHHRHPAPRHPAVLVTSPQPEPPRHLSAERACHLAEGIETMAPPVIDWPTSDEMERYFSAVGSVQTPGSAGSSVTEVLVRRTSVTPQQRVQVLVHRRLTSAADGGRGSATS